MKRVAAVEREPAAEEIFARLLDGDPTAPVDLAELYLDLLTDWLIARNRRVEPELCATAAEDAILALIKRPRAYSLAHELAHFLRDYWLPRRLASERLGPSVLEVFDGLRPPRPDERIDALLARVPIGFHVHLMERGADGRAADDGVETAEEDADRLAFELLAPAGRVVDGDETEAAALASELAASYGLPEAAAGRYAALLARPARRDDSFVRRLGLLS